MNKLFKILSMLAILAVLISACAGGSSDESAGRTLEYTLKTATVDGKMVYIGVGGGIDGVQNPVLIATTGDMVKITLTSGDGTEHDISFPDFNATSEHVVGKGSSKSITFLVDKGGSFSYFCTLPGHREAGMEGNFKVSGEALASASDSSASATGGNNVSASGPVVVKGEATTGADMRGSKRIRQPQAI